MKKTEPQHNQAQNQPAARKGNGAAFSSPQGEHIAQLEAMMKNSPQSEKHAQLGAMIDASPAMTAQRKLVDMIHNSPRQAAQARFFDSIHNSPRQFAQEKSFDAIHASPRQAQPPIQMQGSDDESGDEDRKKRRSKRKNKDSDSEYEEPGSKKQKRYSVPRQTTEDVVRKTAHLRKHGSSKYHAIYTCPTCRRPLASEDKTGKLTLTRFAYTSKGENLHEQRALSLDHHPQWSDRLKKLKKRGASNEEIREDHNDPDRLRALCKVCNESHEHEGKEISGYTSDDEEEGYMTPDEEPENKGLYAPFRRDPDDDPGVGGSGVTA